MVHIPLDQGIEPKSGIRRSELADSINTKSVLNRMLNIPVELTTGEILGVLKELAGLLAESIKPKSIMKKDVHLVYDSAIGNESTAEGLRVMGISEALIELPIRIHGNSLKVVIDTGSQLNIVSKGMYEKYINLLINQGKTPV
ncbi:hypothetical protein EV702DRAFT_973934 [Suillus placidus]|uniref:Aspartic peptidase DDI1-type domain-containing protein n=1 Tax=Suillus placidus TaxID=48579 RepID=A0A9P6ZR65_9AGAM|nr:hypothetical protein EV702DRAFT_973934 [Suillus placidus]